MWGDFGSETNVDLKSDANAAIGIATRTGLGKVRPIEVCQFWLQEEVKKGIIKVLKVSTDENVAGSMTKHASREIKNGYMQSTGQVTSNDRHEMAPGKIAG